MTNTSIGTPPNQPNKSAEKDFAEASQVDKSDGDKKSGITQSSKGNERKPRLPHEHDESSDSHEDGVRPIIEQAHDDVASGKVDTDRGAPMNDTYQKQKKGG
jgi:hypothetical protein